MISKFCRKPTRATSPETAPQPSLSAQLSSLHTRLSCIKITSTSSQYIYPGRLAPATPPRDWSARSAGRSSSASSTPTGPTDSDETRSVYVLQSYTVGCAAAQSSLTCRTSCARTSGWWRWHLLSQNCHAAAGAHESHITGTAFQNTTWPSNFKCRVQFCFAVVEIDRLRSWTTFFFSSS